MAAKTPVAPKGFALPSSELMELSFRDAARDKGKRTDGLTAVQKPLLRPIPPRAVRELEEKGHISRPVNTTLTAA